MRRGIRVRSLLVVGAAVFGVERAEAQATPDLEPGSRIEWAIEKLVGFGLIEDRFVAMRPWSHREASRILDQARGNLLRLHASDREAAKRILSVVPEGRLDARLYVEAIGSATKLDSPWLEAPTGRGTGGLDATINPLVRYQGGRDYVDGESLAGELVVEARLNEYAALQVHPRLWLGRDERDEYDTGAQLLDAQARLQVGSFRLDLGRSHSVWGPGRSGGGLLAYNTRGLDRVRMSSDTPFQFPGFLSFLGPSQAELFFARLEADRDIPHSMLVGYHVVVRPTRVVEVWISALVQSLGDGAPDEDFWSRVADHLFLNRLARKGEIFQSSSKGASLGLRVRLPALRHSQVFAEWTVEDRSSNFKKMFWDSAGWVAGVWVPRVDRGGIFDLRMEFHHSGVEQHRHGQFTSGRTLGGRILGMGGPDTNSGLLEVAASDDRGRIGLEMAVERRSADSWMQERTDGKTPLYVRVEDGPDEFYMRGAATLNVFGSGGRELTLRVGIERVADRDFVAGETRRNGVLSVGAIVPLQH